MARWLVQLSGDRTDLEEYPHWFPDGEVFAVEENGTFFITGPAFDVLSDAEAVRNKAIHVIDRFTAVISLLWPQLKKAVTTHVIRETDDGKRNSTIFVATGTITARSKAFAVAVSASGSLPPPQATTAQQLLQRAEGHPHLETALSLWSDPTRSWHRLYRVLEEVEQHLGKRADVAGHCTSGERERFTRTANTAEASGLDARHAAGRFVPPSSPMTLREAAEFVQRILRAALA